MGANQASSNQSVLPLLLGEATLLAKDNETIVRDASRTADIAQFTVMAQIAATRKWVPWSDLTATDGSALPLGILLNDGGIAAASVAAADVTGAVILVGGAGARIDASKLVFDTGVGGGNSALALTSVLTVGTVASWANYWSMTADAFLRTLGLFTQTTIALDVTEN